MADDQDISTIFRKYTKDGAKWSNQEIVTADPSSTEERGVVQL
ncbi:hypothetical protein [Bacillus cereus]|nr:hypothetical protein [Bacillus cereus]EEL49841.1 hypothetical protein bcere0022_28560 [Bacillus cereus Rock3-44]